MAYVKINLETIKVRMIEYTCNFPYRYDKETLLRVYKTLAVYESYIMTLSPKVGTKSATSMLMQNVRELQSNIELIFLN